MASWIRFSGEPAERDSLTQTSQADLALSGRWRKARSEWTRENRRVAVMLGRSCAMRVLVTYSSGVAAQWSGRGALEVQTETHHMNWIKPR